MSVPSKLKSCMRRSLHHKNIMEEAVNLQSIEAFLSNFEGGDVHLSTDYWDEGIAMLCLNYPEKRNAMSGKMMVDLGKCVSKLEKWETGKAVIILGAGENFCSGGDLDFAKATGTAKEGFYMSYYMQDTLKRFRKLPMVSVSLVHGPAVGGGSELAVFADYILVTDNAKLGFVHGKMGIITAWGGGTSDQQYGFRNGRSPTSAALSVKEKIVDGLEQGYHMGITLCDLSKVFDCVSHEILLEKLNYYVVRGVTLSLIESYLSDRFRTVYYNDELSDFKGVRFGVPQGSVLGPLLLVQILGERKATEMLLSSKMYNAQECLEIGIAYKILSTANRIQEALNFVRKLTVSHSSIVRSFKKVLDVATKEDFETSLSFECEEFSPKWGSDLNKDALQRKIHHVKEEKS
ncbi:unnamed protein product [Phaedon cochleariae]|uniref:Ethylmalonyl-CoA decarboxylase n=1 Tax=Phaedon cochleariae TaxID=80249 RepID=A0A9N9SD55_PHACE|nr:unnamed protein product [Phaedon cochleariae]